MNSSVSISKPDTLSERDWHNLLLAARTGWFAYVLLWRWLLVGISAMALGAFLGSFSFAGGDVSTAWRHFLVSGFFTWGLGFGGDKLDVAGSARISAKQEVTTQSGGIGKQHAVYRHLGFFLCFRILFRSVDRAGKRKLARQIGLLPSTPRA